MRQLISLSKTKSAASNKKNNKKYHFKLFISGASKNSLTAVNNVKTLFEKKFKNNYELEVIDVYQQPSLAKCNNIIAVPTLIKKDPSPESRIIGDLSNEKIILKQIL